VTDRLFPPAIFVYILRHLFTYLGLTLGLFTARDRRAIVPAAMFVDIIRHLFTYQRLIIDLFTPRGRLGQVYPPYLLKYYVICLHTIG